MILEITMGEVFKYLVPILAIWIVYLLSRVCDLKEDARVAKTMSDYYKKKVTELEAKMHDMAERVREQVDGY